jgi:hypothetical protein
MTAACVLLALLVLAGGPSLLAALHAMLTSRERPMARIRLASRFVRPDGARGDVALPGRAAVATGSVHGA